MIFYTNRLIPSIPQDKQGHFIAGVLAYTLIHFFNPIIALFVVLVMAIGKEVYDYAHRDKHNPEVMDAVATIMGGVIGFLCGIPPFF